MANEMERAQFLDYVRRYIEQDPEAAAYIADHAQAGLRAALSKAYERAADMEVALSVLALEAAANNEREACAALCEEVVTHPAGYGGQWEGYGPVKTQRDGKACAAAIRERSNPNLSDAKRSL